LIGRRQKHTNYAEEWSTSAPIPQCSSVSFDEQFNCWTLLLLLLLLVALSEHQLLTNG
jgi:hypothetical protein